jgi:WD40 repeat protein/serine/threonine protein kinase
MDTASEDLELTPGQSVHHYTLLREIGRGGMASVFLARDARLERLVALKLLRRLVPELTRRFLDEARIIARCSHDNIVVIHDWNEFKGQPYLVLEYLRGHTLRREIAQSRQAHPDSAAVPPGRTIELMLPVMRALAHAHTTRIIHRDLKPENIFVTRAGAIKVLDFGIAKVLESDLALSSTVHPHGSTAPAMEPPHTRQGAIMGTLPYMAPEQWRGQHVDQRADVWAVGVMLYEMVMGAHPVAPATYSMLERVALRDDPMPRASEARPDLGELGHVIDRCLIKDRAGRFHDAGELLAALESLGPTRGHDSTLAAAPARAPAGRLWGVPDLPPHYRARDELAPLITALIGERDHKLGVHGMGGTGKSVLAAAAVMAPEVRAHYPDGIFWLSLGQEPAIVPLQTRLARVLGHAGAFDDADEGKQRLKELFSGKRALLVLDDVWDLDHAAHLDVIARPGRLVVTTRDLEILALLGARELRLDVLSAAQGQALLADWTDARPEELPPEAAAVARACGHLPLALAMIGALLRLRKATWTRALAWLEQADLERLKGKVPAYPYRNVLKAIEVGVSALDSADVPHARQCYLDLAVFPEDEPVPRSALCVLWARHGLDEGETDDLMATLVARALAADVDGGAGDEPCEAIRLHDLQRSYVRARARDELPALHGALVDAYAAECDHGLSRGPRRGAGYFYRSLPYHLERAGRRDALAVLLADLDWLCGKLNATGMAELLADYDRLGAEHLSAHGRGLGLVRDALRLSSHVLVTNEKERLGQLPGQLPAQFHGQLLGRLSAWDRGQPGPISSLLAQARAVREGPWLRPIGAALISPGGALAYTRTIRSSRVGPVAITPDGGRALFACAGHGLELWELGMGMPITSVVGHEDWINALAVSTDGARAVSASFDGTCKVWDMETGALVCTFGGHAREVTAVALSPDGRRAISAGLDGKLRVWEMDQGRELAALPGSGVRIHALAVTPDGTRLVCAQADGSARASRSLKRFVVVRDLDSGAVVRELTGHTDEVAALALTRDGARLITGALDTTVRIWDIETGAVLRTLAGHTGAITAVALTRDGAHVVSASADRTVRVWPLADQSEPRVLRVHARAVTGLAVASQADVLVTVSRDRTLRVWDVRGLGNASGRAGHTSEITAVALTTAGDRALSAASDHRLLLWDARQGKELGELGARLDSVTAVTAAPDGAYGAAGRHDGVVELWDLATREQIGLLDEHTREVTALAIHGTRLISASYDRTVKLWDMDARALVRTMKGHASVVQALALTPDGTRAVTASDDKSVRVWDLATGRTLHVLGGHGSVINAVAVTPDGTRTMSACNDRMVRVFDLGTGRLVHTLEGHAAVVWSVVLTPDGTRAISVSSDGTAKVWDLNSGRLIHTLKAHTRQVVDATVLSNDIVLTVSYDRTVRAWDLGSGELLATFTGEAPMITCTSAPGEQVIMAGDEGGRVYFLELLRP